MYRSRSIAACASVSLLILLTMLLDACRKEAPPASKAPSAAAKPADAGSAKVNALIPIEKPKFVTRALIGGKLDATGVVAEETTEFGDHDTVYVTMFLGETPPGLQTSVRWRDAAGKQAAPDERKPMAGEKYVTFKLYKKLKPGQYHVTGYWGGNIAAEYDFTIVKGKAKRKPPVTATAPATSTTPAVTLK
jgi:hypothetical protein